MKIGILSDTHLYEITPEFQQQVHDAFADCPVILHAGDLVQPAVLDAFADKTVYAVHGNMCGSETKAILPPRGSWIWAGLKWDWPMATGLWILRMAYGPVFLRPM